MATSVTVASDDGARSGIAENTAALPEWFTCGGKSPTTPGVASKASWSATILGSVAFGSPPAFVSIAVS